MYFVAVYFTGTPVNISELSGGCWGGERKGVAGCWDVGQRRHPAPRFVSYTRCVSVSLRPSCASSRLGTEAFQEKSAGPPLRSSSAWQCSSCALLWFLSPLFNRRSTGCDLMIKCGPNASQFLRSFHFACRPDVTVLPLKTSRSIMMDVV